MKQTENRFSIDGAIDEELPKSVLIHATIDTEGKCATNIKTNKLTAEQEIKLVVHTILKLNLMVFRAFRKIPHNTNQSKFEKLLSSPIEPGTEKGIKIWAFLSPDKAQVPETHVEFRGLTPEQFAKIVLIVNVKLSEITFDRLEIIKGDTDLSTIGPLKESVEKE